MINFESQQKATDAETAARDAETAARDAETAARDAETRAAAAEVQALAATNEAQTAAIQAMDAHVEAEIVGEHFHNTERWRGLLVAANRVAADNLLVFQATSGNNVYGAGTLVLDTLDTPIQGVLRTYFDLHRLLIISTSQTTVYKLRVAWGTTTEAAAVAAGNYSEVMYRRDAGAATHKPLELMQPRVPVGRRVWIACWNVTNLATIDLFIGLHEYPT